MSFDEEPDGDPHGECAAEIRRQAKRIEELEAALVELIKADEVYVEIAMNNERLGGLQHVDYRMQSAWQTARRLVGVEG